MSPIYPYTYIPIYSLFTIICYSFMVHSFHKAILTSTRLLVIGVTNKYLLAYLPVIPYVQRKIIQPSSPSIEKCLMVDHRIEESLLLSPQLLVGIKHQSTRLHMVSCKHCLRRCCYILYTRSSLYFIVKCI